MTTRFPNGLTTAVKSSFLGEFILPDPTKAHVYNNDFHFFRASEWTITDVGAANQTLFEAAGGALAVINAAADDDSSFLQKVGESFLFETGKKLWFQSTLLITDATQSDVVVGLQITDTTPLAVSDGVYFIKNDGSTVFDIVVVKDSVSTTVSTVAVQANSVEFTLSYYYDGSDSIDVFVDNNRVAIMPVTNLPDDEELTVSFGIQNGEAVSKVMLMCCIFVAKER